MRILLTNDDGIRAPGIAALHWALTTPGPIAGPDGTPAEIFVVAPETVQSATSHGVTFHEPLMTKPVPLPGNSTGIAVDGRPADCVKLAVANLWPGKFGEGSRPDLVISGMNAGANCGVNVIYSGTVAAAIEAAFLGLPSIAVSLMLDGKQPDFGTAATHARAVIEQIIAKAMPAAHECLNVNVPPTPAPGPVPEVRVCPMNTHGLVDKYEPRTRPTGEPYYWAAGHGLDFHGTDPGTDVAGLREGAITVTPLSYDLTDYERIQRVGSSLLGEWGSTDTANQPL